MVSPRKIGVLNIVGLQTLIQKEVGRFLSVYLQTIVAPIVTMLLFFAVFALAFGGLKKTVGDIAFLQFLAPGLIMMTMVQNAFANASSSVVISKIQGSIVDLLMPPLSAVEIFIGYIVGCILRGLMIGVFGTLIMMIFVDLTFYNPILIFIYAVLGSMLLGSIGLATGLWAEKFDHVASITNFIITPLTFLSGTFYSISILPGVWYQIALYNPFLYMIDGFRAGFIGQADADISVGISVLVICNLALFAIVYAMLRTGYKIKA